MQSPSQQTAKKGAQVYESDEADSRVPVVLDLVTGDLAAPCPEVVAKNPYLCDRPGLST